MNARIFLVRGRGVDLVAMTALHALRETMGLGDEVRALLRDDFVVVEGVDGGTDTGWTEAFTARQHWFNPNKHRFALHDAEEGAHHAIRSAGGWPSPWLGRLLATDRPDLLASGESSSDALGAWLGLEGAAGHHAVSLAVYDRDDGVAALTGAWPQSGLSFARGVLWTLVLRGDDAAEAEARAEALAITRTRAEGLLVHPHMQGWARVAPARPLTEVTA